VALDPGQRAVVDDLTGPGNRGERGGVDLFAAKRGLDDRLALLDLASAGFGGFADARKADRAGEELGGGEGGPGDEAQQHDEQRGLDRRRDAEAAKLRPVVNEKIAIAEQSVHRGQTMSH
jgi:hypothetical protein